jgi:hypothetical protein
MGAFMSFTCGNFGTKGGIGLQIGQPADQDVLIGIKDGDRHTPAPLRCLPFYDGREKRATDAFLVEQAGPAEQNVRLGATPFSAAEIERFYGWGTDTWRAGELTFTIYSPFGPIPDPSEAPEKAMREALLPAVVARVVLDNRDGRQTKTGFFALSFARPGGRVLDGDLGAPGRVAFAFRQEAGVAAELFDLDCPEGRGTRVEPSPFVFMRWSLDDVIRDRHNPVHSLATCPGIGFEVPAGKRYALVMAIGSYLGNVETTRMEGRYLYARYYKNWTDVLCTALDRAESLMAAAELLDHELESSALSADQRFVVAHATRSYYGSTQLLEIDGQPLWVVNEGEYCMMNTLDLSVDQAFWELDQNPWVVRNLLDLFVEKYSYVDQIKVYKDEPGSNQQLGSMQLERPYDSKPGGLSFCHDMGAYNNFAPRGHSSYELTHLTGCFSYMAQEQLCNWILMAACYVAKTRDDAWLKRNEQVLLACLSSMVNRGGELGFAQHDSARCTGGQEITTYDSLDCSLAQTRNNLYMAVKCWASYRALGLLFRALGAREAQADSERLALRVAGAVVDQAANGILPAIFEKSNPGSRSRVLPAIEGCLYALYFERTGLAGETLEQFFGRPAERSMWEVLREHTRRLLLDPGRSNLFADGGIKLSSTSNNSWMSKIAIFMHVARRVFRLDEDPQIAEIFRAADAAHVKWQAEGSSYWACCDQIVSGHGKGSRYYPRIVTSALWLG